MISRSVVQPTIQPAIQVTIQVTIVGVAGVLFYSLLSVLWKQTNEFIISYRRTKYGARRTTLCCSLLLWVYVKSYLSLKTGDIYYFGVWHIASNTHDKQSSQLKQWFLFGIEIK